MTDSSLPAASQVAYLVGNTALASVCNCAAAISVPHDTQIRVQVSPEQLLLAHWSPIQEADENRYLMSEVQTNSWSLCVRTLMELPPSPKKASGSFNEASCRSSAASRAVSFANSRRSIPSKLVVVRVPVGVVRRAVAAAGDLRRQLPKRGNTSEVWCQPAGRVPRGPGPA